MHLNPDSVDLLASFGSISSLKEASEARAEGCSCRKHASPSKQVKTMNVQRIASILNLVKFCFLIRDPGGRVNTQPKQGVREVPLHPEEGHSEAESYLACYFPNL